MSELGRLLTMIGLAAGALAIWGLAFAWAFSERRRIRATLRKALGKAPQLMLIAKGRGRGLGLDPADGTLAVVWDRGGWGLTYRLDELLGAELVVDRWVTARAHRGEVRRPLDHMGAPQTRVRLRLLFDDASYPDFDMDLWRPEDAGRRDRFDADEALHEANRWIARLESLMRRSLGVQIAPGHVVAVAPPRPPIPADADFGFPMRHRAVS